MAFKPKKRKMSYLPAMPNCSLIVNDPTGAILRKYGNAVQSCGYDIKIFNTINIHKSMHYNPFAYFIGEEDIINFVKLFIKITNEDSSAIGRNEPFWTNSARSLFNAYFAYIFFEAPPAEMNLETIAYLLHSTDVFDSYNEPDAVNMLFDGLEERDPNHFAVRQYKCYKTGSATTKRSVIADALGRFSCFDFQNIFELTKDDELELDQFVTRKMALFIISSDVFHTYDPLITLLYSQLLDVLCKAADKNTEYDYRFQKPVFPKPVKVIGSNLKDMNIPYFDKLISVTRSRGIDIVDTNSSKQINEQMDLLFGNVRKNNGWATWFNPETYLNNYFLTRRKVYDPEAHNIFVMEDEEYNDDDDYEIDENENYKTEELSHMEDPLDDEDR